MCIMFVYGCLNNRITAPISNYMKYRNNVVKKSLQEVRTQNRELTELQHWTQLSAEKWPNGINQYHLFKLFCR